MVDEDEAAEAFRTLGDPTRIAILLAFAEVIDERRGSHDGTMPELSFSELYDRVDVDSTSRLSYHLDELDGTYLRRTGDGWKFTFAAEAVVRLVLSEAYVGSVEFEPVSTSGRCLSCGATDLVARVEDYALVHECRACDAMMGGLPVTPAQARDRDPESLLESATTTTTGTFRQYRNGVCTSCGGVVDPTVVADLGDEASSDLDAVLASGRCRECWRTLNGPLSMWLANHPASVAFHWDHGVDVLSLGIRDVGEKLDSGEWEAERVGTAPPEYEVTYSVGANVLRLVVDDGLIVSRTERVRRDSVGGERTP